MSRNLEDAPAGAGAQHVILRRGEHNLAQLFVAARGRIDGIAIFAPGGIGVGGQRLDGP